MMGYENDCSAYRILRCRDKKIVITKHAEFVENEFIGLSHSADTPQDALTIINPRSSTEVSPADNDNVPRPEETISGPITDKIISSEISTSNILAFDH